MADDKKKVRGNKDEGSNEMPKDPGSTLFKGPTDDIRANEDGGKGSKDES